MTALGCHYSLSHYSYFNQVLRYSGSGALVAEIKSRLPLTNSIIAMLLYYL